MSFVSFHKQISQLLDIIYSNDHYILSLSALTRFNIIKDSDTQQKRINIAIDGFSSCGKSTLAKDLAAKLEYLYIDSGAMYRAVTLYIIQNQIALSDTEAVKKTLDHIKIDLIPSRHRFRIDLGGIDVTERITHLDVSSQVSEVAAISAVRKKMVRIQQEIGKNKGVVMDGRDIGTVVYPAAELKLFVTANTEIRAMRRYNELKAKSIEGSIEEIKQNLRHRDHIDSTRQDSPLRQATDAVLIDNSFMSIEEQLFLAYQFYLERI